MLVQVKPRDLKAAKKLLSDFRIGFIPRGMNPRKRAWLWCTDPIGALFLLADFGIRAKLVSAKPL
jgi:hypothetical protein